TASANVDQRLSDRLSRSVRLNASAPQSARAEGYWPDYHWLEQPDEVFDFELPSGTFFDGAPIHVLIKATLGRLAELLAQSDFDVGRFRPNYVLDFPGASA